MIGRVPELPDDRAEPLRAPRVRTPPNGHQNHVTDRSIAFPRIAGEAFRPVRKGSQIPQPLSRVCSDATIILANAGTRPLSHNPGLGVLAMEAIISWSNVEQFMLSTYVSMMGGPTELAAVGYLALETQTAKSGMIRAIAEAALEPRYRALLDAILKVAKTSQGQRDRLAHWVWGYSPQVPDGFLLADPRKGLQPHDRDHIFVYKERDFREMIDRNDRICGYGLRFKFILINHIANANDAIYRELCAEPEIQERLARSEVQNSRSSS